MPRSAHISRAARSVALRQRTLSRLRPPTDDNAATSDARAISFLKLSEPQCHKAQPGHARDQGASSTQALQQRLDKSERDRVSPLAIMSEGYASPLRRWQ